MSSFSATSSHKPVALAKIVAVCEMSGRFAAAKCGFGMVRDKTCRKSGVVRVGGLLQDASKVGCAEILDVPERKFELICRARQ
mmetsp:Transcript_38074/g.91376  ORF Transcript_38074/g.91376 Transcript_38074/m.91376 type:complete len:83 (-) Transcript_38074:118-366(-)